MKLDRNINGDGRGKYALILLRNLAAFESPETFGQSEVEKAIETLSNAGLIDWGNTGTDKEFFLIRLKDKYASNALTAYANAASRNGDFEYAGEIFEMASRAGEASPFCKAPD